MAHSYNIYITLVCSNIFDRLFKIRKLIKKQTSELS